MAQKPNAPYTTLPLPLQKERETGGLVWYTTDARTFLSPAAEGQRDTQGDACLATQGQRAAKQAGLKPGVTFA